MQQHAVTFSGGLGVLSALTFFLTMSLGAAIIIYLPLVPLLVAGFHFGFRRACIASAIAVALSLALGGLESAAVFAVLLVIPALITVFLTMRAAVGEQQLHWYPVLRILAALVVYITSLVLLMAFHYSAQEGGLEAKLVSEISDGFAKADPEFARIANEVIGSHAYILIASTAWLWILMVYLMALVSHLLLESANRNVRPQFSLLEGAPPQWLLPALVVCIVGSFVGGEQVAFVARAITLMLLLPYFMFGMAHVHRQTTGWNHRGFLLSLLYLLVLTTLWPAVLVCVYGVVLQVRGWGTQSIVS